MSDNFLRSGAVNIVNLLTKSRRITRPDRIPRFSRGGTGHAGIKGPLWTASLDWETGMEDFQNPEAKKGRNCGGRKRRGREGMGKCRG